MAKSSENIMRTMTKNECKAGEESTNIESLAHIINSVDGVEPSPEAKIIIHLYAIGEIDVDSAKKKLLKEYHS